MPAIWRLRQSSERLGRRGVVAVDVDDHGISQARSGKESVASRPCASLMPWRCLISAAAGEAMKASSAAAASARGERVPRRAGEGGHDRQRRRQGPQQLDAGLVAQLAQLLEAELDPAAGEQRGHGHAGRRLHQAARASARRCPSARTASARRFRSARSSRRCARQRALPRAPRLRSRPRGAASPAPRRSRRTSAATAVRLFGNDVARRSELADRICVEHHEIEAFAGADPARRLDAADRFEPCGVPPALLPRLGRASGKQLARRH